MARCRPKVKRPKVHGESKTRRHLSKKEKELRKELRRKHREDAKVKHPRVKKPKVHRPHAC